VSGWLERQQCGQSTVFEFVHCPACDMLDIDDLCRLLPFANIAANIRSAPLNARSNYATTYEGLNFYGILQTTSAIFDHISEIVFCAKGSCLCQS
jgi:hypothetical protein